MAPSGPPSAPLALDSDGRTAAADYSVTSLSVDASGITASGGNNWRPHMWWSTDGGQSWTLLPNPVHAGCSATAWHWSTPRRRARGARGDRRRAERPLHRLGQPLDAPGDAFPSGGTQPFATSLAVGPKATVAAATATALPRERHARPSAGRSGSTGAPVAGRPSTARCWPPVSSPTSSRSRADSWPGTEDFGVAAGRQFLGDSQPDGLVWTSPPRPEVDPPRHRVVGGDRG